MGWRPRLLVPFPSSSLLMYFRDVTNRINLTPVALLEGHCFADTEFGGMDRVPSHENVACAVFSQPPLGTVGMTEAEAAKKFPKVAIFKSGFRPMVHTMTGMAAQSS